MLQAGQIEETVVQRLSDCGQEGLGTQSSWTYQEMSRVNKDKDLCRGLPEYPRKCCCSFLHSRYTRGLSVAEEQDKSDCWLTKPAKRRVSIDPSQQGSGVKQAFTSKSMQMVALTGQSPIRTFDLLRLVGIARLCVRTSLVHNDSLSRTARRLLPLEIRHGLSHKSRGHLSKGL